MKSLFTDNECRILSRAGVQAVYLFGSRAQGREHALSDYDYAILAKDPKHTKGGKLYNELYKILSRHSPRSLANDVIDIIFLHNVGLEMRFHVVRHGRVIFDAEPKTRLAFEVRTTLLYSDYRPILDEIDNTILESL